MNKKLYIIGGIVLAVVVLFWLVGGQSALTLSASGTRFPNGVSADSTSPSAGQLRGTTLTVTGASTLTGEVNAPLVEKGSVTVLTTQATSTKLTLTAAQVCDSNIIQWDIQNVSTTLELPTVANVTADCLIANGDSITFLFDNIATTTAIATVASSTWELIGIANTNDLIDGENQARITLVRTNATSGFAIINELVAAD